MDCVATLLATVLASEPAPSFSNVESGGIKAAMKKI